MSKRLESAAAAVVNAAYADTPELGDLIIDLGIALSEAQASTAAHREQVLGEVRERLEEAAEQLEELEAATDTWQDRDSLPAHCRRLGRRARHIHTRLRALADRGLLDTTLGEQPEDGEGRP